MGSPRARLGLGVPGVVMDCYIRLPVYSALNTRVMRNTRGPSLHREGHIQDCCRPVCLKGEMKT